MYIPPQGHLYDQLVAIPPGETPSSRESLERTQMQPWFDELYDFCRDIDRRTALSLETVDWTLVYCDGPKKGACVYQFKPTKAIVLRPHWINEILRREFQKFLDSGPVWIGSKVIGVDALSLMFGLLLYLHEVMQVIYGHNEYENAHGTDSLTHQALEMDADIAANNLAYDYFGASFRAQMSDDEFRLFLFAAHFIVMWELIGVAVRSHPSFAERIARIQSSCATIGRLDSQGSVRSECHADVNRTVEALTTLMFDLEKRTNADGESIPKRRAFMEVLNKPLSPIMARWFEIAPDVRQYRYRLLEK